MAPVSIYRSIYRYLELAQVEARYLSKVRVHNWKDFQMGKNDYAMIVRYLWRNKTMNCKKDKIKKKKKITIIKFS